MAAIDYAIIPKCFTRNVGTTATRIATAALLVPAAIISANGANSTRIYLGDSGVATTEGISLNARESVSLDPFKLHDTGTVFYNLNEFYVRATASSQVVSVTIFNQARNNA